MIGNGNVALDVARMLALTPEELAPTDTTDAAIEAINAAGVQEILVVGRRGPVQAAWTPVEVGELGELAGADILVDPAELELDAASAAELEAAPPTVKRNVEHLREYAARAPGRASTRAIRLRFLLSPVAIVGDERVEAIELVRNELVDGRAVPTGERRAARVRDRLSERRVSRRPAPGRPVRRGAVHHAERRRSRARRRGRGGARRLLRGLDQARPDAASSGRTRRTRPRRSSSCSRTPEPGALASGQAAGAVDGSSRERGVAVVTQSGWEAIDAAERAAGEPHGRPRVKLAAWDELLEAAGFEPVSG